MRRIYYVRHDHGKARLIRADNRAQALGAAARSEFTIEVASQETIVELCGSGTKVENATEKQVELSGGGFE